MKAVLAIFALAAWVALFGSAGAHSYQYFNGVTTGNNSTDTTITVTDMLPGRIEAVSIWAPDADCRVTIEDKNGTVSNLIHVKANADPIIWPGQIAEVKVYKLSTVQRVTVIGYGN